MGPHPAPTSPLFFVLFSSTFLSNQYQYIPFPFNSLFSFIQNMEDYYNRSKSYGPEMMSHHQTENIYYGQPPLPSKPPVSYDLRCYSASYAQAQMSNFGYRNNNNNNFNYNFNGKDFNLKKGKSVSGSSSSSKNWSFADPEFQRKKRVASYKMYSVEGKVKGTFRKSFRWLKDRYTQVLYGWW